MMLLPFLKSGSPGNYITFIGFCHALHQLGLTGYSHGLSSKALKRLWVQVDIDSIGIVDYGQFQRRKWDPIWEDQLEDESKNGRRVETIGLNVKYATFFPSEVEKGKWPDNYSLSDHVPLSVTF